jgi:hypothetical protein
MITEAQLMTIARSDAGGAWSAVDRCFIDKLVMFAREVLRQHGAHTRVLTKEEVRQIYLEWRRQEESTGALYQRIRKAERSEVPNVED